MSPKDQQITNWKDLLTMNTIKNNKILIRIVLIELRHLDHRVSLDNIEMLNIIKILLFQFNFYLLRVEDK